MERAKILVVDDESRMRKLVKDFLTREGYIVLEAGDGMEAMDLFYEDKDIALIILDVMMPKMDGLQATQVIRSFDHDIPIVAMTANAFMEDKIKAKKAGMNAHVSKPLDRNILIQVIAKLCGYKNV